MRFDLTDMRLFLTVVETGSITRGARAMHLALASASERIAGMEAALGTPLLDRNRRGVSTTAAGDALVGHAREILGRVEQMRGELRTFATGLKGRIRLLANTAALGVFLPPRLCRFLTENPDLSVDIEERTSVDIVRALADRRGDLGIVADTADLGALQTHVVARDQLVVMTSRAHPMASLDSVAFADVLDQPIVGMADSALETYLGERASRLGGQFNFRVQLRTVHDVAMHVEAGIGVSLLSEALARSVTRDVAILPLSESWGARRLILCARDFSKLSPHAVLLARELMAPTV